MDNLGIVKKHHLAFWLVCITALAIVFVSEYSYRKAVKNLDELETISLVRTSIQRFEGGLFKAEAGERGYVLTTRHEYLESYDEAVNEHSQQS